MIRSKICYSRQKINVDGIGTKIIHHYIQEQLKPSIIILCMFSTPTTSFFFSDPAAAHYWPDDSWHYWPNLVSAGRAIVLSGFRSKGCCKVIRLPVKWHKVEDRRRNAIKYIHIYIYPSINPCVYTWDLIKVGNQNGSFSLENLTGSQSIAVLLKGLTLWRGIGFFTYTTHRPQFSYFSWNIRYFLWFRKIIF